MKNVSSGIPRRAFGGMRSLSGGGDIVEAAEKKHKGGYINKLYKNPTTPTYNWNSMFDHIKNVDDAL
ncbi:hypothetical protein, partial [Mycobacterium tuberculosis]